jgi:hypothetical protein
MRGGKMTTHELKTWPEFFWEVISYKKRFELRRNDIGFKVGDVLHLKEWNSQKNKYSGNSCKVIVLYYLNIGNNSCVLSISKPREINVK